MSALDARRVQILARLERRLELAGLTGYAEANLRPELLRCCAVVVDDPNRS